MVRFLALDATSPLTQIHRSQVIVRLQQIVNGVSYQSGFLFKSAQFFGIDQQMSQLVPVDILFQSTENPHHRVPDPIELFLQSSSYTNQDCF